jgi:hypothetical protein
MLFFCFVRVFSFLPSKSVHACLLPFWGGGRALEKALKIKEVDG